VNFVVGNSNKLQKIGFGRKNELSPQCVHTWANNTGYTSHHELVKGHLKWMNERRDA
jgi:hypothetical protein